VAVAAEQMASSSPPGVERRASGVLGQLLAAPCPGWCDTRTSLERTDVPSAVRCLYRGTKQPGQFLSRFARIGAPVAFMSGKNFLVMRGRTRGRPDVSCSDTWSAGRRNPLGAPRHPAYFFVSASTADQLSWQAGADLAERQVHLDVSFGFIAWPAGWASWQSITRIAPAGGSP